jgi:CDP-diacylglycerol--serine O-phosphatidyltransferase
MIKIEKYIPNALTFGNLLIGFVALLNLLIYGNASFASTLLLICVILDFADGFLAKLLKSESNLGKQLDSLADIVSFGVLPSALLYTYFLKSNLSMLGQLYVFDLSIAMIFPLIYLMSAAYRLARFNNDLSGNFHFEGLPTPASAVFVASIPLFTEYPMVFFSSMLIKLNVVFYNFYVLIGITLLLSILGISKIKMTKISTRNLKSKPIIFLFILSFLSFIGLQWLGLMISIVLYVLISLISSKQSKVEV